MPVAAISDRISTADTCQVLISLPRRQYSLANMIVITRSVTEGSDGSGE